MKQIKIYEPELITRRGFNGFFSHFLPALIEHAGAKTTNDPRPLPRMVKPREHESCWVRFDDHWMFFDMSDHVQLMDLDALKLCSVYFKANLHRGIAQRVLRDAQLEDHESKLAPFLFFSEGLTDFVRDARRRRFWRADKPNYDLCFVMGVYENLVRDGFRSPFEYPDQPMPSSSCHFWIRWHTMNALRDAGISGFYRLTSRGNRSIEDGINVSGNLKRRTFSRHMTHGRMTAVHTFPHALFPWKASESFALGRPILIEQSPLTETPEPFMPIKDLHYLELFPHVGTFDPLAPLTDSESHRVLTRIPVETFAERATWLREQLNDHVRLAEMGEACRDFAERVYDKKTVADYICEEIKKRM